MTPLILVTNDDGIQAKGLGVLAGLMAGLGDVLVMAPETPQSGQSNAITSASPLRFRPVDREGRITRYACTGTPTDCVKMALEAALPAGRQPDLLVSGINHGSNAASASCYSGTLGAAQEAALCGIPAIGVSLCSMNPDADFSAVEEHFPGIMRKILEANERPSGQNKEKTGLDAGYGIYYNVNFPDIPAGKIRGIRTGYQGKGHWVREFTDWDPTFYSRHGITPEMLGQESAPSCEEGEKLYMMVGTFVDDPGNDSRADHHILENGYISVVAHNIDTTDYRETDRLGSLGFDTDF